ncbi:Meiosis-specific cyclin crs1 [Schizosaccharomyces pombe]
MLTSKHEFSLFLNTPAINSKSEKEVISEGPLTTSNEIDVTFSESFSSHLINLRRVPSVNSIIEQEKKGLTKISPSVLNQNIAYKEKRQQLFSVLYEETVGYVSMDTLCIAISLLDRCFTVKPTIPTTSFKIYAIGCLFIAFKLTSDYSVAKKSFCENLAPSLSTKNLEKYEKIVLALLNFDIYVISLPSVESFLTPLIFQHVFFKSLPSESCDQMMVEWQYLLVEIMKG